MVTDSVSSSDRRFRCAFSQFGMENLCKTSQLYGLALALVEITHGDCSSCRFVDCKDGIEVWPAREQQAVPKKLEKW